jgi:hypothetical protein
MPRTKQDLIALGLIELLPGGADLPVDLVAPDGSVISLPEGATVPDEVYDAVRNRVALHGKLTQARDYFSGNYRDWGSMTNAQKDQAGKQAQRALANIARYLLDDLTTEGD